MANSLLDFVMSLVRDPDAAAQYAANPAQAIADAHLTDVTSVDVNHLIPVVAESMSTAVPSGGFSGGTDAVLDSAHNVWASGAATAAFDAFGDHLPVPDSGIVGDHAGSAATIIDQPADAAPTIVDHGFDDPGVSPEVSQGFDAPTFDDGHVVEAAQVDDAHHDAHHDAGVLDDNVHHPQDPGFDIFA
jgi:hypothetical protein